MFTSLYDVFIIILPSELIFCYLFFLDELAKLRQATTIFDMSVCPSVRTGTTRLPLDGFS
jgi:hypothetical protein